MKDELNLYLAGCNEKEIIPSIDEYSNSALDFWKLNLTVYQKLAEYSKSVFVVQASSGESERHFSIAGNVVTSKRSSLSATSVEQLVVLKEAYTNKLC